MLLYDTSRDPKLMHPFLRAAQEYMFAAWEASYPDLSQPFLTCTFRGPKDQRAAFERGASNADFGQSLHNFEPAYAFDIAFLNQAGNVDWSFELYELMSRFGDQAGLQWGGRWPGIIDGPHFQLPMAIADAQAKRVPEMPPLPPVPVDDDWQLVVMRERVPVRIIRIEEDEDVVLRYARDRKRVYLDLRKAGS